MQNKPYEFLQWEVSGPKGDGTFEDLKLALSTDNPEQYYPIGYEFADTYANNSNPLIVAQYLDSSNNSSYGGAEGVILVRKYVDLTTQRFGPNNKDYPASTIKNFLDTTYLENSSSELKPYISNINIPFLNSSVDSKWFLMSATEVCAVGLGTNIVVEGIMWDLWKQRTGLSSPSNNANSGRIMRNINTSPINVWLRSNGYSSTYAAIISTNGTLMHEDKYTSGYGVLPACFISSK